MHYATINPASGQTLATYKACTDAELDSAVLDAGRAYSHWRELKLAQRCSVVARLAELLAANRDELALLITTEMGKPVSYALAEIDKCAASCTHYAENAEDYLRDDTRVMLDGRKARVRYLPSGIVFGIMPWNFPFWQVIRAAVPAILAGNSFILKHAPNTPGCALRVAELLLEASDLKGLFTNVFLSKQQSARLIAHPDIRGVTLTGSARAGRQVAELSGRSLKPILLELGGSDPFVVMADADVKRAARQGATARCFNSGQVCCAPKRFLVHHSCYDEFCSTFASCCEDQRIGDPAERETTMGPLARDDIKSSLLEQVNRSVSSGAHHIATRHVLPDVGNYVAPCILLNASPDSPALREELFGPVAAIIPFKDDAEAVEAANRSAYGLSGSIWTADPERAEPLARKIDVGTIVINGIPGSDPAVPFGGVKDSGFGRELGAEGIRAFSNIQSFWAFD